MADTLATMEPHMRPEMVVLAPMNPTMTSWLNKVQLRQCMLMWGNSHCLSLCHLLVPGSK
jgi:hypothetical protein